MERRTPALNAILLALAIAMGGMVVFAGHVNQTPPMQGASSAQARRWVATDPLSVEALRSYGLALDREGQAGSAEAVLTFAGRRSWRDLATDRWLFGHRLIEGRLAEAFDEADAMLRLDLDEPFRAALIHVILLTLGDGTAQATLVQHLAASPWWRLDFMRRLDAGAPEDAARAILFALLRTAAPPTQEEYAPYIQRLVDQGAYHEAWADWRQLVRRGGPPDHGDPGSDFAAPSDGSPFTWTGVEGAGATTSLESGALRMDYDGYGAPILPGRLLALPAGRYSLSWRERRDPSGPSRVVWGVACVAGGPKLAQSAPASSAGWANRSLVFEVPPAGCPAIRLGLSPLPGERRADGVSWFQAPSVVRLGRP